MTKRKNTKRALTLSALSLLVCVAMLIGSTYAWFTDSVTSGSNVIKSGKLDIVMEYWDGSTWVDAEGQVIPFVAADGRSEILWEPGCTYEMAPFRIRNEGNLSTKLIVLLSGVKGDEKLMEAIELKTRVNNIPESVLNGSAGNQLTKFEDAEVEVLYGMPEGNVLFDWSLSGKGETTPGTGHTDTSPEFTLFGHMAEEAGNEYQNLSIEGVSITVVATQQTYEYDSFDKYYDKDAPYPRVATNADELKAALQTEGSTVVLENDISITKGIAIADGVVFDFNGHKIIDKSNGGRTFASQNGTSVTFTGNGSIVKDGTIASNYAMPFYVSDGIAVVENGTYHMGAPKVDYNILVQKSGKLVINGGTFTNTTDCPLIYAIYSSQVEINGGHFESIGTVAPDLLDLEYNATRISIITIKGGTFVNYNPLEDNEGARVIVADGYKVVSETKANGDIWYTVVAK